MKMYDAPQSVDKYLNVKLECSCGRTHYAPIKHINISSGAINTLPDYVREGGYKKPYMLCDAVTYEIAGRKCESVLKENGYEPLVLIIRHLGFDEATLGEIVINKPDDCDLMIGVGTGSITDMLRFSSFKLGLPCFTVPTGAPMDGFSASVGIMNVNNLKATMPAHSTEVIIGDTDVLSGAPYRMTAAGFGDLIGKLNAINDWHLGALINEDHYCENMDALIMHYVDGILAQTDDIRERKPEALGNLMNALLLTGATISLYGSSRAISGAEHHMSHYWEVLGEQRGKDFAMHGEQVAVGTVLALRLVEKLRGMEIDFDAARDTARAYSEEAWRGEIRRAYGNAADAIIELEEKSGKNTTADKLLVPLRSLRVICLVEKQRADYQRRQHGKCYDDLQTFFHLSFFLSLFFPFRLRAAAQIHCVHRRSHPGKARKHQKIAAAVPVPMALNKVFRKRGAYQ